MILFWDSYASVNHRNSQELIFCHFYDLYFGLYLALRREFQGISLKPQKNLHDSLLITADDMGLFLRQLAFEGS